MTPTPILLALPSNPMAIIVVAIAVQRWCLTRRGGVTLEKAIDKK
jgi:hypothetical protein